MAAGYSSQSATSRAFYVNASWSPNLNRRCQKCVSLFPGISQNCFLLELTSLWIYPLYTSWPVLYSKFIAASIEAHFLIQTLSGLNAHFLNSTNFFVFRMVFYSMFYISLGSWTRTSSFSTQQDSLFKHTSNFARAQLFSCLNFKVFILNSFGPMIK